MSEANDTQRAEAERITTACNRPTAGSYDIVNPQVLALIVSRAAMEEERNEARLATVTEKALATRHQEVLTNYTENVWPKIEKRLEDELTALRTVAKGLRDAKRVNDQPGAISWSEAIAAYDALGKGEAPTPCPECNGNKYTGCNSDAVVCEACDGTGEAPATAECPHCGGTNLVHTNDCEETPL